MTDDELLDQFKLHIELDSDADTTMLNGYLKYARRFVKTATGKETNQMVLMVAALLFDFRVSDKELGEGLESLTPFLLSEVFADDEANESTQTQTKLLKLVKTVDGDDRPVSKWEEVQTVHYADLGVTASEKYLSQQAKTDVVKRIKFDSTKISRKKIIDFALVESIFLITRIYVLEDERTMEVSLDYVTSFSEMRSKLKGLGLPVFRDVAESDTPYPYYVYSFVSEDKISASGVHQKYLPEYQISLFTKGTEADLKPFKRAFSETPYERFISTLGDENDETVTNFYTYIKVMADE